MRKFTFSICPSRSGEVGLTARPCLLLLAFSVLFQVSAVALHSSSPDDRSSVPAAVVPHSLTPSSSEVTKDAGGETATTVTAFSDRAKRLLDLSACITDSQCWGRGRRCVEGRCWGFAGPRPQPFKCASGTVCTLSPVNGHFYGQGSRGSRGLFMLRVVEGPLTVCGEPGNAPIKTPSTTTCAEDSPDCVLADAGKEASEGSSASLGELDALVVGEPVRCLYPPGITAQAACTVRLGFVKPSMTVGSYALCGCSSTDLAGNGEACSSDADFSVPVGTLQITGFASPAIPFTKAEAPALATAAKEEHASEKEEGGTAAASAEATTVKDTEPLEAIPASANLPPLLLPRFSCAKGLPCELPGIRGHGLETNEHFVRAFPGVHRSCEEAEKVSTPLRLACSAASGGSRCIVSARPQDLEVLLLHEAAASKSAASAEAFVAPQQPTDRSGSPRKEEAEATLCGCRRGLKPSDCVGATLVGLLHVTDPQTQHQPQQQQQQLRKLQFIEDRPANMPEEDDDGTVQLGNECAAHVECLGGYGKCVSGRCRGFIPDLKNERLIRCVEGYHCDAGKGDLPTKGNKENFVVIGVGPEEECGAAVNLKADASIFNNANKWICSSSSSSSCELRFGVARRLSRSNTIEGLRLCGCPALDINGDNQPCNHMRDFRVPLGRVSVQECITNAHCADRQLAYCIKDHCGGFLVSAAAAGVNAFACVRNQDCTLENVAARGVSEALKVIPIAAHLKCGSEAALDPNFLPESALPCVADVDADGKCDVHLGVNHFLGTHRLCGCSGADIGGSGAGCDEAADFGVELGLLNSVDCVAHSDCPIHSLCAKGECVTDDLPPTLVASDPAPGTFVVPPLQRLELQFNEDVLFGRPGASLLVSCKNPEIQWVITLPEDAHELKIIRYTPALFPRGPKRAAGNAAAEAGGPGESSGVSKWVVERQGQRLRIIPDEELSSLPPGEYTVSFEFGFVTDLTGNPGEATPPFSFTLSRDAGCPLLYATGFATENGNPNGMYTPIDPVNKHAAWRGGEANAFFVYYRRETETEQGNWVVDTDLDEAAFLAFADVSLLEAANPQQQQQTGPADGAGEAVNASILGGPASSSPAGVGAAGVAPPNAFLEEGAAPSPSSKSRRPSVIPPSGLWHKWTGRRREEQPFVAFICRGTPDHLAPTLVAVKPPSKTAEGGGPHVIKLDSNTGVALDKITLVFSKPVNYGHWAGIRLVPRGGGAPVAEWVTDQEAGMRGPGGSILVRSQPPPARAEQRQLEEEEAKPQQEEGEPGVVELTLEGPILEGGKEYDLVADLGALTDYHYNPWGPLAPQTVVFIAAATHCPLTVGTALLAAAAEAAEPDGPEAQAAAGDEESYELVIQSGSVEGDETEPEGAQGPIRRSRGAPRRRAPEGAVASARCAKGLSLPFDLVEGNSKNAGLLRCRGGKWEGALSPCVPVCGAYPPLGEAYEVEEKEDAADEGLSGATITIRCTAAALDAAAAAEEEEEDEEEDEDEDEHPRPRQRQQQQLKQTLTCHSGKWDPLTLKCASTCPPLGPSLGVNYRVLLPDAGPPASAAAAAAAAAAGTAAAREGESRIVSCSASAQPGHPHEDQQVVRCSAKGWEPQVTLSCKGNCRHPPRPNSLLLQPCMHWMASAGYGSSSGLLSVNFVCEDGLWVRHKVTGAPGEAPGGVQKAGASVGPPFSCVPLCPPLTLDPRAFKTTPIASRAAGGEGGAAAAAVRIECAEGSTHLGGPPSEILRCEGGLWTLRATTCAAGCGDPIAQLGKHFAFFRPQSQQQYKHGDTVDIRCSDEQLMASSAKPHTIACVDGRWESSPHVPGQQQQQQKQQDDEASDEDSSEESSSSSSSMGSSGGVLLRCSATCNLPALPAHFRLLSSTGQGAPKRPLKAIWNEGEKLVVGCSPPFDGALLLPPQAREQRMQRRRQQQQLLQCMDGSWVGELKDQVCVRPCPGPSGGPSEAKWKEWGVACGASCNNRCGSCYNGKRDREEEGVDCGGPFCVPCSSCSPQPLKQFLLQPRLYSSTLQQQQHQQQQDHEQQQQPMEFPIEMTRHGSKIGFTCTSSPSLSLRVSCSNGKWTAATSAAAAETAATASDASHLAFFAAACIQADVRKSEARSSSSSGSAGGRPRAISAATAAAEHMEEEVLLSGAEAPMVAAGQQPLHWREPELLQFGAPLLRPPAQTQDRQQQQQQQQQQQTLSTCMSELVTAVSRLLVGECGALAFGASAFKVASFCKGTCSATYKRELQQAADCSSKTAAAAAAADPAAAAAVAAKDEELLQLFYQLLDVFCEVHDGRHCFGEAAHTLGLLQKLHHTPLLQQQLQQHVCPGSSGHKCFTSNIRYVSLLQRLRQHLDVVLPGSQQQQTSAGAAAAAAAAGIKGSGEGLIGAGIRGLLTDLTRVPAIVSLLCAEVEGRSCASQVLQLGSANPFAALPAQADAAAFCSSNSAAPCLLEAYRLVGQQLLQPHPHLRQQKQQQQPVLHPHDWALGTVLLSVGRSFCLRSAEDQTCGALLLPAAATDPAAATAAERPYVPAAAADLPGCSCPLAFVGDGECDLSCNTAACAFDRGDCLAQQQLLLQPIVESLETSTIPRADGCFPFNAAFNCGRKDCRHAMQAFLEAEVTVILAEALSAAAAAASNARRPAAAAAQERLSPRAAQRVLATSDLKLYQDIGMHSSNTSDSSGNSRIRCRRQALAAAVAVAVAVAVAAAAVAAAVTACVAAAVAILNAATAAERHKQRNSSKCSNAAYASLRVQMQLDRTCSRGLNRFAFVIDATLEGMNYAALRSSSSSSSNSGSSSKEEEALRHVLRDTLAGALGVPVGDVLLIRTWQGLDVHALIDSGPLSNKPHFLHAIETLRGSGPIGLASQIEAELRRQQKAAAAAKQQQQQQLQQQDAWSSLVLHRVPLLLDASLFTSLVSVPESELSITQIAFSSPGSSSSNSRRQQQQLLPPEMGTWGLGKVTPRDVPCSTNQGLSAPPNTSVFEAYRLQSTADINAHGSVITVECGRGYTPVVGSSPQQLVCQQGRWAPLEASVGGPPAGGPPERLLRCRKPCGPYEVADTLVLGPAFVSSGVGELDGDRRDIYCASGFVAAAASMPRTDTVVCTNGRWSRRQLECIKDFSAIADSSPCASALSLLPSSLRVETLQIGGGQGAGAAGGPGVSTEVAAALNNTFQRAGVSLQLFRIGCARGFIAAALQQQQQQQQQQQHHQQHQHQYTYAACKDGLLLDLGTSEPLPLGAFASGDAAEALVHQLKLRLDGAPYASTDAAGAAAAAAGAAGSSPAASSALLDGEAAAAAAANMARGSSVMKGRASGAPVLLGSSLGCLREVRHEPPKAPKPVSDTLLVFSCLLLLFVLVVALLAFWWYRSRRREKKAAKLQQQQQQQDEDADMRDDTSSGFGGGFFDPTERHSSSFVGRGGGLPAYAYGGPPGADPHLQHHLSSNSAAMYGAPGGGPSHAYSLDADLQRGSHRAGGGLPSFATSKEVAAAEAAAADEQSLALYAPVYYTGGSGDRGFPRDEREAAALAAAAAAQNGSSSLDSQAELLRRVQQQQQQQQMLLQQRTAAILATARRADLQPADSFKVRSSSRFSGGPSAAAYLAAAADAQQQLAEEQQQGGGKGGREETGRRSSAIPAYPGSDAIQQQQLTHAASRKTTGWEEERGPQAMNESAVSSAEGHLSEDEELYPEDSASCVAMTASQNRDAAAAAAAAAAGSSSKGGSSKQRPLPRGQSSGKPPRVSVPSIRSVHRRHAHI
ncbi:hypothetical protein Emed_000977 [Eimeria media]